MKRILVIDDDRGVLELLKRILEKNGYQVDTAGDAVEGLAQILDHPPDLITLDILMPGVTGIDKYGSSLCSIIKKHKTHRLIPIVIISIAKRETDPVMEEMVKEADAYFMKPFKTQEVVDKISALLENKK